MHDDSISDTHILYCTVLLFSCFFLSFTFTQGVPKTGDRDEVSSRDKRDVTRLLSDVLRWKRRLDFIIDELQGQHLQAASSKGKGGKKKVKPFDSIVRQILRMGAYELYFLRKPAYVVSEYVDLAKTSKDARGAAGLINSLLRKVSVMDTEEEKARPELEGMGHKELVRHLGTFHSHPDWLVDRWLKQFGLSSCLELLRYNNVRPQYCIRTNPCNGLSVSEMKEKLNEIADVQYRESKLLEDFIVVEKGLQNVFSLGLIQDGRCSVQDVSAGLVVHLMDPKPGERVLDVCAAPGGKFYYAASRMGYEGKLVALDASRNRMKALEKGTRNFPETLAIETYSQTFEEWSEQNSGMDFDKVLVDAPCSGSGVLAKRADLRWRRTEQDLSEMIEIQARLLDHAKNHVKVGGCLLYSTCSIDREENSMQVQKFLSENKNFRLEENSVQVLEESVRLDGFLQTFPQEHGIDGAFAARLTRIA